ncbi:hypothetical protein [Photobacterium damselae]|uniref:hypothetical protein n=1 Tax=Photobacterium damselae TaxID=38293 RepID=UPI00165EBAF0|nr:hypothetical protein [Photobacterium damselae]
MTGQETVYSALTNLEASYYSLSKSYGFGVGMGGHPHSYDLYFSNRPDVYLRESSYGINRLNAHNLFIRSISELGLFFVFLLVVIFSLFRIKNIRQNWIFIASLSYLISRFIKLGGYFDHGLPVFLIVIILIVIENRNKRKYESFVY